MRKGSLIMAHEDRTVLHSALNATHLFSSFTHTQSIRVNTFGETQWRDEKEDARHRRDADTHRVQSYVTCVLSDR